MCRMASARLSVAGPETHSTNTKPPHQPPPPNTLQKNQTHPTAQPAPGTDTPSCGAMHAHGESAPTHGLAIRACENPSLNTQSQLHHTLTPQTPQPQSARQRPKTLPTLSPHCATPNRPRSLPVPSTRLVSNHMSTQRHLLRSMRSQQCRAAGMHSRASLCSPHMRLHSGHQCHHAVRHFDDVTLTPMVNPHRHTQSLQNHCGKARIARASHMPHNDRPCCQV